MIANPDKFHSLIIKKDRTNTCGMNVNIQDKTIKSEETVKLLGVQLDYKLNFEPHISELCRKAATQLNVLKRLKSFIGFKERETLVQSFVYSNFNYCPLVWCFSSAASMQRIEKIQERALRFLYHDHSSSYSELLSKSSRCTMHISRLKVLCVEIFKTLKSLNPSFMQDIFKSKLSNYSLRQPFDLQHHRPNQVTFGSNSLRSLGPQIWNGLPNNIKTADNLNIFKRMIKEWDGPNCKCNVCKYE